MDKIGKYQVLGRIGGGAMGVVHRCLDPVIGREVAIKVMRKQEYDTEEQAEEARKRFEREAAAAGRLKHPNIVTVHDIDRDGDLQYLVMELIESRSLDRCKGADPIPILRQIASALDYAHARGVVHRDIKPPNILLAPDGQVTVTDFGIARIVAETMTMTGVTMGTLHYMAPEQIMSSRVDGKADQFSLAVMAFELLTGQLPFEGQTPAAVMFAIVHADRPAAHEVNRALPAAVSDVLKKALAKEPGDRFEKCAAFVAGLEAARRETVLERPAILPGPRRVAEPMPGSTWINPKDGLTYVWIPPGTFQMGASPGDSEASTDEKPAHQVTITKGFWLGQTPVTQKAYEKVIGVNPSHFKGPNLPVEEVSWEEAQAYCRAAGGRLPTEAEWEYAARAGTTGARYGELDDIAWHYGNSSGKTHDVGQKLANAFGLHDMLGNVWEWVANWYGPYAPAAQRDPTGPASGSARVLRGGSWYDSAWFARVSFRDGLEPENRYGYVGLRCAGE